MYTNSSSNISLYCNTFSGMQEFLTQVCFYTSVFT